MEVERSFIIVKNTANNKYHIIALLAKLISVPNVQFMVPEVVYRQTQRSRCKADQESLKRSKRKLFINNEYDFKLTIINVEIQRQFLKTNKIDKLTFKSR
jgi:hypothetical protein